MLDADEKDICIYLKSCPGQFISGREICRRAAGKKRFRDDPYWATSVLIRLVEKKLIESDSTGHYRILPEHIKKKNPAKKWVSPHIKKILETSGKDFSHVIDADTEES
jgi:hypothetical protein